VGLDADLIAYYEAEARAERRTGQSELRIRLRRTFAQLLRSERRGRIVDVGAGPGLDVAGWEAEGFSAVGVDLAPATVEVMHRHGLSGVAGSLYQLPFRNAAFDALWSMSTFVHVPDDRFDEAITELVRVVQPGGVLGIGTWGGLDFEGVPESGDLRPYRFFSLASHRRWRAMLSQHGEVELFETHRAGDALGWEYQFAVVRAPA
jgi:SAM-dependent methyltransferase